MFSGGPPSRLVIALFAILLPAAFLPLRAGSFAQRADLGSDPRATLPDGRRLRLEIARTPAERARGYMFRESVGSKEGMLFLFPDSDFHTFWMKNCRVSLDILWLGEDLRVVHLEERVPPCRQDPCPAYAPMRKARYVLELRAGMVRRAGIHYGDPIRIEGVEWDSPGPR